MRECTREQLLEVPCLSCSAKAGQVCKDERGHLMVGFHRIRQQLREKYPVWPSEADLTPTDKALITYYGFVMVCDSVSAHSEAMFGKHFSSQEIQMKFAKEAIIELRKDGLLKHAAEKPQHEIVVMGPAN